MEQSDTPQEVEQEGRSGTATVSNEHTPTQDEKHNSTDAKASDTNSKDSSIPHKESEDIGPGLLDQKGQGQEHTRSKMAILFVLGFFGIIFMCFAYAIKVNATLAELKDALVAVIGALSGTLGFIVGYYYKSTQEK